MVEDVIMNVVEEEAEVGAEDAISPLKKTKRKSHLKNL